MEETDEAVRRWKNVSSRWSRRFSTHTRSYELSKSRLVAVNCKQHKAISARLRPNPNPNTRMQVLSGGYLLDVLRQRLVLRSGLCEPSLDRRQLRADVLLRCGRVSGVLHRALFVCVQRCEAGFERGVACGDARRLGPGVTHQPLEVQNVVGILLTPFGAQRLLRAQQFAGARLRLLRSPQNGTLRAMNFTHQLCVCVLQRTSCI
jgi:hypothetical protein